MELRCPNKLHAKMIDSDTLEVSCDSRFCGKTKDIVILHRYSLSTGELIQTLKYRNPVKPEVLNVVR